jgi:hypothetical protein
MAARRGDLWAKNSRIAATASAFVHPRGITILAPSR